MSFTITKSIAADFGGLAPTSGDLSVKIMADPDVAPTCHTNVRRGGTEAECAAGADVVDIIFDSEPDAAGKTAVDAQVGAYALPAYKKAKHAEIDKRTRALIQDGTFPAGGETYSSSDGAKARWADLKNEANYPFTVMNADDSASVSIADVTAADVVTDARAVKANSIADPGVTLKESVIAAADIAAVDAVVDNR